MVWRRLLVPSDTTIAQLHDVLQIAMGWEDLHLHQFLIHGKAYGVYHEAASPSPTIPARSPRRLPAAHRRAVRLRVRLWRLVAARHPARAGAAAANAARYPVCTAGHGDCPPEDCGGPAGYAAFLLEERCSWQRRGGSNDDIGLVAERLHAWQQGGPRPTEDDEEYVEALDRLREWLERCPQRSRRRAVNAALRRRERGRNGHARPYPGRRCRRRWHRTDGRRSRSSTRGDPTPASLGLTLAEGKQVLAGLQAILVTAAGGCLSGAAACLPALRARDRSRRAPAPSGRCSARWRCRIPAGGSARASHTTSRRSARSSALLPERTSPELRYLETSWAADASYGRAPSTSTTCFLWTSGTARSPCATTPCKRRGAGAALGPRAGHVHGGLPGAVGSACPSPMAPSRWVLTVASCARGEAHDGRQELSVRGDCRQEHPVFPPG